LKTWEYSIEALQRMSRKPTDFREKRKQQSSGFHAVLMFSKPASFCNLQSLP